MPAVHRFGKRDSVVFPNALAYYLAAKRFVEAPGRPVGTYTADCDREQVGFGEMLEDRAEQPCSNSVSLMGWRNVKADDFPSVTCKFTLHSLVGVVTSDYTIVNRHSGDWGSDVQINIYVPKEKEKVVGALDEASRRTGRPKSELVLDALEEYLQHLTPPLPSFHLGQVLFPRRDDLYLDRDDA